MSTSAPASTGAARASALPVLRAHLARPLSARAARIAMGVAVVIAAIVIATQYRDLTFYFDEWDFVLDRRGWDLDTFLRPHNEHLHLVPVLVYKLLFVTVGLGSYWPYAMVLIATHVTAAWLLFEVARRAGGNEVGLAAGVVLLFLGSAWQVLLWPFMIGVTISLAAALGALLALGRRDRAGDVTAGVLLTVALASSSLGVPFVVGLAVLILSQRGPLARLAVVVVPGALYALWYLGYGSSSSEAGNLPRVPVFVADSAAGALGAATGLTTEYGRSLAVAAAVVLAVAVVRRWGAGWWLCVALVTVGLMWTLLCLSRFGVAPPDTSRYLYPGVALVLLAAAAVRGPRPLASPGARGVLVVAVAVSVLGNIGTLRDGAAGLRGLSEQVLATTGALDVAGLTPPADFSPAPTQAPTVQVGELAEAERDLGSYGFDAGQIAEAGPEARAAADDTLRRAGGIALAEAPQAAPGREAPAAEVVSGSVSSAAAPACRTVVAAPGTGAVVRLDVPMKGLIVDPGEAPVEIKAAVFAAPEEAAAWNVLPAGGAPTLVSSAGSGAEWRLQLSSPGDFALCAAG